MVSSWIGIAFFEDTFSSIAAFCITSNPNFEAISAYSSEYKMTPWAND